MNLINKFEANGSIFEQKRSGSDSCNENIADVSESVEENFSKSTRHPIND